MQHDLMELITEMQRLHKIWKSISVIHHINGTKNK